jgi:hypothetical protein
MDHPAGLQILVGLGLYYSTVEEGQPHFFTPLAWLWAVGLVVLLFAGYPWGMAGYMAGFFIRGLRDARIEARRKREFRRLLEACRPPRPKKDSPLWKAGLKSGFVASATGALSAHVVDSGVLLVMTQAFLVGAAMALVLLPLVRWRQRLRMAAPGSTAWLAYLAVSVAGAATAVYSSELVDLGSKIPFLR